MKAKLDSTEVPSSYLMCLNTTCSKAANCLRQLAVSYAPESRMYWSVISPKYLAALQGECPHFRLAEKVPFAKGFIGIIENLTYNQMKMAVKILIGEFSSRTYYRMRKGERLLSPGEQKIVLAAFKKCGATGPFVFDAYVNDFEW